MTDPHAASSQVEAEPGGGGLRRDSLNLRRLAFIGLAYFSLAPVIYLNMGFMESDSGGPVMPFLYWAAWWSRRRRLSSISLSTEA